MENLLNFAISPEEVKKREILQSTLDRKIGERSMDIQNAINKIEQDGTLLHDFLVPTNSLNVEVHDGIIKTLGAENGFDSFTFSDFAINQLSEKIGVPARYMKKLWFGDDWMKTLAVQTLNEHTKNIERDRLLLREVSGQIRGVLSDSYRRLNSMQIYLAFLSAVQTTGAKLVDAHSGNTKGFLEVILPHVQSIPTEKNGVVHLAYGAQIRNSDFGDGALELKLFEIQIVCMNGMTTDSILREIHLGRKLPSDLRISEDTYRKDTEAQAALVSDAMKTVFDPEYILEKAHRVQKASSIEVDMQKEIKALPQLGMTLEEVQVVENKLIENNPNDGLQGQNTLWKFAQTIGAVARDSEDGDRKRELSDLAGSLLMKAK